MRGENTVVLFGSGMVDLCDDEVTCGGDVATVRVFEPEGGLFGVDVEGAGRGGEEGLGWDEAESGAEGEVFLFVVVESGEKGGGNFFAREEGGHFGGV